MGYKTGLTKSFLTNKQKKITQIKANSPKTTSIPVVVRFLKFVFWNNKNKRGNFQI